MDIVPFLIRSSTCLRPSPTSSFCDIVSTGLGKLVRSASSVASLAPSSTINVKRFQGLITAVITATNLSPVTGKKEEHTSLNQREEDWEQQYVEMDEMEIDLEEDNRSFENEEETTLNLDSSLLEPDVDTDSEVGNHVSEGDDRKGITFTPSVLHYTDSPACIPSMSDFTISNNFDHSIYLTAVTSDNSQYYPVLFQPQSLAANSSLNIQLLFLPYYIETSEATLTIASSEGDYEYKIIGRSIKNPYNLHPLSGFRVPAGVPYEQSIIMKNPHSEVLQVREIFTTEDFLSLKGTSGDSGGRTEKMSREVVSEGQTKMWEIQPGEEKEVVVLMMSSSIPGSYNGYVHVKTDKDNIVLPIDLTVLKGGLFASPTNIDFGTITSSGISENAVKLWLMNSDSRDVLVNDILPLNPDKALVIKHENRLLKAGKDTLIATLSFDSRDEVSMHNKVLIMTNNSNPALATVEIPYEAHVLHGGISIEIEQTIFYIKTKPFKHIEHLGDDGKKREGNSAPKDDQYVPRNFTFTNACRIPAILEAVDTASCGDVLTIKSVPENVAQPFSQWDMMPVTFDVLKAKAMTKGKILPFTCWIELKSNISTNVIDLYIVNPHIKVNGLAQHENFTKYSFKEERVAQALDMSIAEVMSVPIIPKSRTTVVQGVTSRKPLEQVSAYIGYISTEQPKPFEMQLINHNVLNVPMRLVQSNLKGLQLCTKFHQRLLYDPELFSRAIEYNNISDVSSPGTCLSTDYKRDQTFKGKKNEKIVFMGYSNNVFRVTIPSISEEDGDSNCINKLCFVQFDLETKYQYLTFRLFYKVTTGHISLRQIGGGSNVVLGSNDPLLFSVHSSYKHGIGLFSVHYESELFRIRVRYREGLNDDGPLSGVWEDPYRLDHFHQRMRISPPTLQSQVLIAMNPVDTIFSPRSHVEHPSVYRYTINVLRALDNPSYDYLVVFCLKIDAFLLRDQLALAHMKIREYKDLLATPPYRDGIKLPDMNLTLGSEFAEHTIVLTNLSLHLQFRPTPAEAKIVFPPLRVDHISVFYFEVHNNWGVPLMYSFSERNNALVDPKVVSNIKLNEKEKSAHLLADQQWKDDEEIAWCKAESGNCDWSILGASFQFGEYSNKDPDALPINDIFTLTTSKVLIPPNSTGLIGPNVFVPHLAVSKDISEHAIYLRNNFTGVEMISITSRDGSPRLIVASITSRLLNESEGAENIIFTSLPGCNDKDLAMPEEQAICDATEKNMKIPVHISNGDSLLRITVKNIGGSDTSADVAVEDGSLGRTNSHYPRTNKLTIVEGEEMEFFVEVVSNCKSYHEKSRLMITPHYSFVRALEIDLSFDLSADGKKICLEASYGPVADSIIRVVALIIILISSYEIVTNIASIISYRAEKAKEEDEIRKKLMANLDDSLSSSQDDQPLNQEENKVQVTNVSSEETTSSEMASNDDDVSSISLPKSSDSSNVSVDKSSATRSSSSKKTTELPLQTAVHEKEVKKESSLSSTGGGGKKEEQQQQRPSQLQEPVIVKKGNKNANITANANNNNNQKSRVPSIKTAFSQQEDKVHATSPPKTTARSNSRHASTSDSNTNGSSLGKNSRAIPLAPSYSSPEKNAIVTDVPKSSSSDSRPITSVGNSDNNDNLSLSPLSRLTKAADSAATTGMPSTLVSPFDELCMTDDMKEIGSNRRVPAIGEERRNHNAYNNLPVDNEENQLFPAIGEEDVSIQSILKDIIDSNKSSSQSAPLGSGGTGNFFLGGLGRDNHGVPVSPPPGYGHHLSHAEQTTNSLLSPHSHSFSPSIAFNSSIPSPNESGGVQYSPFASQSPQDQTIPSGFFSPGNDSIRGLESFWGSDTDPLNLNGKSANVDASKDDDEDWERALKTAVSGLGMVDEEITFDSIGKGYGAGTNSTTRSRIDHYNGGTSMFGDLNSIPAALEGSLEEEGDDSSRNDQKDAFRRRGPPPTANGW